MSVLAVLLGLGVKKVHDRRMGRRAMEGVGGVFLEWTDSNGIVIREGDPN
jgi:hypothetical protein